MKRKTNPRRLPVSKRDARKAFQDGIHAAFTIFLNVLRDRFDFDQDQIADALEHMNQLLDSLQSGYIKVEDLDGVLRDEAGITRDSDTEGGQR